MEARGSSRAYVVVFVVVLTSVLGRVKGQISTACTASMVTSFTPCMNFITGSSSNGASPTTSCCGALKDLMAGGVDCACLLITANVPFQLPINRSLALSLPRACNMDGVPIQCKSAGSPLPAPGPDSLGPSPIASSPLSPRASKASAVSPSPQSETAQTLSPTASPAARSGGTTGTPSIRPVLNPATSSSVSGSSSFLQLIIIVLFVPIINFL